MNVKDLLLEQKFFEDMEEINTMLEGAEVEDGSIIQSVLLDKEVFATEAEALEYAASKGFSIENSEETDKQFMLTQFDVDQFSDDSLKQLELRRGVFIIVGLIKPMPIENDFFLNLKKESNEAMKFSDSLPHIIELATTVEGFHAAYGDVSISREMLLIMERNFNEGVVGVDLMIDYDHDQREAAGWIKEVFLSEDKTTLYGVVRWTPKGALALNDRNFRYFSPEFSLNYVHPHSGVSHGPTLLGGGLVNRPFLKMDAIVGLSEKNKGSKNMDTISLKDHEAKVANFEKTVAELKLSEEKTAKIVEGLKNENVKLSEKLEELEAEKTQKELEAKNERLFSEGKINKAQLDALNEGKDFYDVMSLAEKMNQEPQGETGGNAITLSEQDKKVCDMLGLSAEEFVKYNK